MMMNYLCDERFHVDMQKDFQAIPDQDSLMPSLYYEGHVLVADVELLTDANTIIEELKNERMNQVMSW